MPKVPRVNWNNVRQLLRYALARAQDDRIPQVAGSLTFTSILSIVPLFAVTFALFTAFPIFNSFRDALQGFLLEHLMPESVNAQIFKYLNQFASKATGLTAFGLVGLLVTAVLTLMTIESAFNVIWRVPRPRPLAQRLIIYWSLLTLGPLLFGVSLSISSYIFTQSMSLVSTMPPAVASLLSLIPPALTSVAFMLMYVYMPNCKVEWRDALVGGIVAAIAFDLTKRGFGMYIRRFPTYTAVYGAFAAVPIFLLWVYLSWLVALLGATITSVLPALRLGHFQYPRFPGSDLLDGLTLIYLLNQDREAGRGGLTIQQLARAMRTSLEHANDLLTRLERMSWVGRLSMQPPAERWLLLANPRKTTLAPLVAQLALNVDELARQLERHALDGAHVAAMLREGNWDVPLADALPCDIGADDATGQCGDGRVDAANGMRGAGNAGR
ncbi:YihY family inner membrane protein [Pandoraea pnomenusa]|uniref:YihY family inner membrane protein n=1 Tax=Pandoraea pnomenusa TaxID=93220 RepID=UPI0011983D53|nr:YihY family inner membrane protein [Pandoraea pnomenusa]QDX22297.1 YihY family inner membrane protein [Pandoraea pnomenusa]